MKLTFYTSPVSEAKSYSVYTHKYTSFDEFCKNIKTMEDLHSWMRVNDLQWPDGKEWQTFRYGPFQWPEMIFKHGKISCIDIAAFAYLFCRKNHIHATIAKFAAYVKFSPWKEPMRFNHYVCLYEQSDGWYSYDYSMDKSPVFSIPSTYGPFQTIDILLNKLVNRYTNGLDFVYRDQKIFRKLENINQKCAYMTEEETEGLYKLYKSGISVGRWDYFDKNVKSFKFKEDEGSTKNPNEQHMDSIVDYTMTNAIKHYNNAMKARQAIIDKIIQFFKTHISMESYIGGVNMERGNSHFVMEGSSSKFHIGKGKLDLSNIQFIRAPHTNGGGFCENSMLIKDGKKYRVRAELLIYNDRGQVLATKRDKVSKYGTWYNLPGGSLEPGKSIEDQAAAEAREEVFAEVEDVKNTGIWFTNMYPVKSSLNPKAWDYELAIKYGLDYDGAITIVCIGKYSGRYGGRIAEQDKVDWGKKAQFYDPDDIKLSSIHRKALAMAHIPANEAYVNTSRFVTESIGQGTYDYPLNTLNVKKFASALPALRNAKIGKGFRGLIHAKLEQPTAHPVAFVNIELKTGNVQASHGDPVWIGKAKAKIMAHAPKVTKESYNHFVTEETALKNPYNRYGNIKTTRRVDHKQPVRHPSTIKKYVNSHENYTDFF